jgi:hypothetical protein
MQSGHVTLIAKNVTIRQILAEWERVGQKVVNGERLWAALESEFADMPEQQALDIILRSVSGCSSPHARNWRPATYPRSRRSF